MISPRRTNRDSMGASSGARAASSATSFNRRISCSALDSSSTLADAFAACSRQYLVAVRSGGCPQIANAAAIASSSEALSSGRGRSTERGRTTLTLVSRSDSSGRKDLCACVELARLGGDRRKLIGHEYESHRFGEPRGAKSFSAAASSAASACHGKSPLGARTVVSTPATRHEIRAASTKSRLRAFARALRSGVRIREEPARRVQAPCAPWRAMIQPSPFCCAERSALKDASRRARNEAPARASASRCQTPASCRP